MPIPLEPYMELKDSVVDYLDAEIRSGSLHPHQVAQMMESLEERYLKWADGIVPEDIKADLIQQWYETRGLGMPLHQFLRINETQYKRHVEPTLKEEIAEAARHIASINRQKEGDR